MTQPLPGGDAETPQRAEYWSDADERLVIPVAFAGEPGDDEGAKQGIWTALIETLEYIVSGRSGHSVPDHVGDMIRVRLELLVSEDVLGPQTLAMLEDFAEFCASRSMELVVQPVVRELMVGRRGEQN